jgi:antitoxin component YwqK of YwqJK toxin-antitoxin module
MGFFSRRRNKIIEKEIEKAFSFGSDLHDTNIYWEAFEKFAQEHGGITDKHFDGGQDIAFTYSIYDVIAVRDRMNGTACLKVSLCKELVEPFPKFLEPYTTYYDDGQIESEYHYLDGKRHGSQVAYYQNGQTQYEGYYENGFAIGTLAWWYSNGQFKAEHEYIDGILKKDKNYHYRNGHIETEINYKKYSNGQTLKFGKWIEYYKNGHKKIEGKYTKDKKNGKWTEWNKKGQIVSEKNYKNDLKDGSWTTWFENGNISIQGSYINDKKDGEWKEYFMDGRVAYTRSWKDGVQLSGDVEGPDDVPF